MDKSLNLVSLFSGGGFLDIGFMNQGFQILEAVEVHEPFINCYNEGIHNYVKKSQKSIFKDKLVSSCRIESPLDASDVTVQSYLESNYKYATGIIGGPPCQDFSQGGKNGGITGNRGKLIFTYLDIVNRIEPLFIFFENVSSLFYTKQHQTGFFDLKNKLEKDYYLQYEILNALDYGVPQDRPRLTLVGFKKDLVEVLLKNDYKLIDELSPLGNEHSVFKWPTKRFFNPKERFWPKVWNFGNDVNEDEVKKIPDRYSDLFVKTAFENLTDDSPNQDEHFYPYSGRFTTVAEGHTKGKSFKRLHRYRYSPTVAYGNNEVHLHPTEPRRLTVREALKLQSVPDNYVLPKEVPLTDKFKLIGNGVPTKKAELIAKEIKRTLENYYALV